MTPLKIVGNEEVKRRFEELYSVDPKQAETFILEAISKDPSLRVLSSKENADSKLESLSEDDIKDIISSDTDSDYRLRKALEAPFLDAIEVTAPINRDKFRDVLEQLNPKEKAFFNYLTYTGSSVKGGITPENIRKAIEEYSTDDNYSDKENIARFLDAKADAGNIYIDYGVQNLRDKVGTTERRLAYDLASTEEALEATKNNRGNTISMKDYMALTGAIGNPNITAWDRFDDRLTSADLYLSLAQIAALGLNAIPGVGNAASGIVNAGLAGLTSLVDLTQAFREGYKGNWTGALSNVGEAALSMIPGYKAYANLSRSGKALANLGTGTLIGGLSSADYANRSIMDYERMHGTEISTRDKLRELAKNALTGATTGAVLSSVANSPALYQYARDVNRLRKNSLDFKNRSILQVLEENQHRLKDTKPAYTEAEANEFKRLLKESVENIDPNEHKLDITGNPIPSEGKYKELMQAFKNALDPDMFRLGILQGNNKKPLSQKEVASGTKALDGYAQDLRRIITEANKTANHLSVTEGLNKLSKGISPLSVFPRNPDIAASLFRRREFKQYPENDLLYDFLADRYSKMYQGKMLGYSLPFETALILSPNLKQSIGTVAHEVAHAGGNKSYLDKLKDSKEKLRYLEAISGEGDFRSKEKELNLLFDNPSYPFRFIRDVAEHISPPDPSKKIKSFSEIYREAPLGFTRTFDTGRLPSYSKGGKGYRASPNELDSQDASTQILKVLYPEEYLKIRETYINDYQMKLLEKLFENSTP